ncbi:uncharacterized protein LOC111367728 isoform X2 [Olea europaea var. sylvestris]|uniref:uncharacterized protein LOC111367728 isoform X2 n=1 Tax=Olea europaea var. sylvestris TaxID=158386 RepID=UPI000C1D7163|nr:uncharacterized protein LOC111367728 isoform X2 [Olea europaea var. sylvestris]
MEVAVSDAAGRGVSLPMSSSFRRDWHVIPEQSLRNSANEEMERLKLGQCDERLIYEQIEPVDLNFCSIPIDGRLESDISHQRFHAIAKRREELQHVEIELRAQIIAGSEVMQMQNNFDAQIKEHANASVKLQEQLNEKEQMIHQLERKIEEKERELHAIRLDNEAAWGKEDLLMEQSKELQSYRRERDNSEAEKAQHIEQIHDIQERIQDKEQRFMELQEQNRIVQETILLKDEQLREAQSWMTRAQEMSALQSTGNHTLQAELQERTEQCNQLWFGCHAQFGEMERLHLHIQQLLHELADVREKSGSESDRSRVSQTGLNDASHVGQSNGTQVSGNFIPLENSGNLQHENAESSSSFPSGGNASMQIEHVQGVPFTPSLPGMPTYIPPGQLQPLVTTHQLGLPHTSVPSHVTLSLSHSVPALSSHQHWQSYVAASDGQHMPSQELYLQREQNSFRVDVKYDYEASMNGQVLIGNYLDAHSNQGMETVSVVPSLNEEGQVLESIDKSYYPVGAQSQQSLQQISSQFHEALRLDFLENNNERKEMNVNAVAGHAQENKSFVIEKPDSTDDASSTEAPNHAESTHAIGKPLESALLDERSLLACIVRTIGSGGRTRISSTLPNRLGKVLAPLQWHDYKQKYGNFEDFVISHPELFVIGGDYIQLREGAQEKIAATAAIAEVTAAASSSYSVQIPSVAVTPVAHPNRLKKASSLVSTSANIVGKPHQFSSIMQNKNLKGVSFDGNGGVSKIKILSKPKDRVERI